MSYGSLWLCVIISAISAPLTDFVLLIKQILLPSVSLAWLAGY